MFIQLQLLKKTMRYIHSLKEDLPLVVEVLNRRDQTVLVIFLHH